MKPTLFILAAGMGNRYGGLKQLDKIGPSGETIMDYSIYDAIKAGFGKIVFVIRPSFEEDFKNIILKKFQGIIETELVFQEISKVPVGFSYSKDREKPWGTNHAILMGSKAIKEPFGIINADDFYGQESFVALFEFLKNRNSKDEYCMVGYNLENTLSENGSVNRGICEVDESGFLKNIVEKTDIKEADDYAGHLVSMNMWGFTPDYFEHSLESFKDFLAKEGQNLKSEFYIPSVVNDLITQGKSTCRVLRTPSKWFGMTYIGDRDGVVSKINDLIESGAYPERLFL